MYRLLERGRGKLFCYTKGLVPLNDNLSQKELKELFNAKCEFVIYEPKTTTESEASTQEPVHSETESDSSNGSSRRKANNGKRTRKPKTN